MRTEFDRLRRNMLASGNDMIVAMARACKGTDPGMIVDLANAATALADAIRPKKFRVRGEYVVTRRLDIDEVVEAASESEARAKVVEDTDIDCYCDEESDWNGCEVREVGDE